MQWHTTLNLTIPKNKLVAFPDIETSTYKRTYAIGSPLDIEFVYQGIGVDPNTGLYVVQDVNGDGIYNIDDRKTIISYARNWFGGFTNTFFLRQIEVNFHTEWISQRGRAPFFFFNVAPGFFAGSYGNQPASVVYEAWTKPTSNGLTQKFSRSSESQESNFLAKHSSLGFTDASYVRVKSVSISYNFQSKALQKMHMASCRIYVQGQNLLTITKYKGLDPSNADRNAELLPPLKTVTCGLQIKF